MSFDTLLADTDARGVVTVTLNQPDKRNALSETMIAELTAFARGPGAKARAVVLRGAGKLFCAGGDLDWMRRQIDADRATRMTEARKLAMMLNALNEMPSPLIARVHGGAFGGGVGLMAVADVVVAGAGAKFGLTETRLGLIPATIGPYVLARMGEGMARRVFHIPRIFDAPEAERLGLVARVVPEADLDAAVEAFVKPCLTAAPGAVAAAKSLARALGPVIDGGTIDDSIRRLADTWEQPEAAEGIAAFFAGRPPGWSAGD